MKLRSIEPANRLIGLGENNQLVNLPKYSCPHCHEITAFSTLGELSSGNFKSPFAIETKFSFDTLSPAQETTLQEEQNYIDFFCRVCLRPVRVIFSLHEFHMSSYHCYAQQIIEAEM